MNPDLRLVEVTGDRGAVELTEVPFHPQEAHQCGPASLLTMIEASGVVADYASVVEQIYVPGLKGSLQVEILAAGRRFGRIAYVLPPRTAAVLAELEAGRPVLVLLNLGLPSTPVWHYAVVIGFDTANNRMILRSGKNERSIQRAPVWLRRWEWGGRWAMVLLRPGEWPASAERGRLLEALAAFEDSDPVAAGIAWRAAAGHWPDEPIVWLGIGNAAHRRGDWQRAREAYERTLSHAPNHPPARYNLALSLAEQGMPCEGLSVLGSLSDDEPLAAAFVDLEGRLERECAAP